MDSKFNLTIGKRISFGFLFCIILLLVLAIIGFTTINGISFLAEVIKSTNERNTFIVEKEVDHLAWVQGLDLYLISHKEFTGQLDYTKCSFGLWLYSNESQQEKDPELMNLIKQIEDPHERLHASAKQIMAAQPTEAVDIYNKDTLPALTLTRQLFEKVRTRYNNLAVEKAGRAAEDIAGNTRASSVFILIISIISVIAAVAFSVVIIVSLTRVLKRIIGKLSAGSMQIASASTQLAISSQEIANGATEQASAIEEASSSMEELASMVRQNVDNTREAALLAEKAAGLAQTGHGQMTNMLDSMTEINKGSVHIGKVIKVIDDIAFQTNILALNAAVEAARAGETGMGFAVVADEVKNLANRSAQAAKETAVMIDASIKRVESGLDVSAKMADTFKDLLENATKLSAMVKEVEAASRQQDSGINQVNKAVVQFDQVVQSNAGSAEETASSARDMQAQVESLNVLAKELTRLVLGNKAKNDVRGLPGDQKHEYGKEPPKANVIDPYRRKTRFVKPPPAKAPVTGAKALIPFQEDEEFTGSDGK